VAGNLYGTTISGGASGTGVVFKLSPAGTETVLYDFTGGADGAFPQGGLIRDAAGNLYGTTRSGGDTSACASQGCGVVFELIRCRSAPSGYDFRVLYTFTGGADGGNSQAGLVLDAGGNLYGTTAGGGSSACSGGCGVVFKLSPIGTETVLHSFTGGADGGIPAAGLTQDSAGNLYGTTFLGGASGNGVVFKLTP
jgi:uncharacterized repeat protein (TIGR03803 family)